MTLEKIRAALPTHIMLTPGTDVWREGDEILGAKYVDTNEPAWITPIKSVVGAIIKSGLPCRRLIPPHILDNQAFWLRFGDTVPGKRVGTKQEHDECAFLRPDGNGGAAFYLQSTAGRLYDKWLLEQMGGAK